MMPSTGMAMLRRNARQGGFDPTAGAAEPRERDMPMSSGRKAFGVRKTNARRWLFSHPRRSRTLTHSDAPGRADRFRAEFPVRA